MQNLNRSHGPRLVWVLQQGYDASVIESLAIITLIYVAPWPFLWVFTSQRSIPYQTLV